MWSYFSTIFTVGAGLILLPFILHKMPQEVVGLWNIFATIAALVMMLDFGFRVTFTRNISYIFSGVKKLQKEGVSHIDANASVDYSLLKGALIAMRQFYRWMAIGAFVLLSTAGTAYFYYILQKYSYDKLDALIAWILLIAINSYNLYTYYYDALLIGKGLIKRTQQINILGQTIYIGVAIVLIYSGFGLTAIVGSQLISIIIRRILIYRSFFTPELKKHIQYVEPQDPKEIFNTITPNAIKIGLTQLGGFLVTKSAILIGSAFLTLEEIACYGITIQAMDILSRCATVFYNSYTPKLAQCRVENNIQQLRHYYLICICSMLIIFLIGGVAWIFLGEWALGLIQSQTHFLPPVMIAVLLAVNALEQNHAISAGFILADNKIPFFIPSLISGAATIVLLFLFLGICDLGIWSLILAPGLAQLAYQNWKWPSVVIKEFTQTR